MYMDDRTCTWMAGHIHGWQDMYMDGRSLDCARFHVHASFSCDVKSFASISRRVDSLRFHNSLVCDDASV